MPKTRVSITIDRSLLERVDRVAGRSRSEIVERALKRWLNDRRRSELEAQVVACYLERESDEVADDREWSELGADQIGKTWK